MDKKITFDEPKKTVKVVFLVDTENSLEPPPPAHLFAFFTEENFNSYSDKTKVSYSHVGQHSACSLDYARGCRVASKEESESLKAELEQIGYVLEIVDRW